MPLKIPAPETDFLDPRTGKITTLWYQYLFDSYQNSSTVYNTINYGPTSRTFNRFVDGDGGGSSSYEPLRGPAGRPGRDGVTKIIHVYLPADENEPMTVYRRM